MFKAQVLRRSFSVFNRVPTSRIVQSAARDGHQTITIHRIRIRKPFFSRQRLVGAVAIATATYGLGQYLGIEVEIQEEEVEEKKPGRWKKQVRNQDGTFGEVDDEEANREEDEDDEDEDDDEEEEEEEEEYDDAVLFFPTGFSREKPKTYYRGSDPEWQEFKKLSQDKARIEKIRQDLVNLIRHSCSTPAHVAKIGEVDHKKGRVWIEFKFPDGPPPEFERPGYELTEDLEWRKTTRDVDSAAHHRLTSLLRPDAAAAALYEDTKRKAAQSWTAFSVYMGWAEKTEHLTVQQMIQQTTNPSPPSLPPPPTSTSTSPFTTTTTTPPTSPNNNTNTNNATNNNDNTTLALPDPQALTLDLTRFRQTFNKAHRRTNTIPRGSFAVHALIEVYGSRARLTLNVLGVYDPKQARFVDIHVGVWNQAALRQSPRGGA